MVVERSGHLCGDKDRVWTIIAHYNREKKSGVGRLQSVSEVRKKTSVYIYKLSVEWLYKSDIQSEV